MVFFMSEKKNTEIKFSSHSLECNFFLHTDVRENKTFSSSFSTQHVEKYLDTFNHEMNSGKNKVVRRNVL